MILTQNVLQKICMLVIELQQLQVLKIRATQDQVQSTGTAFDEAPQTACWKTWTWWCSKS